MTRMRLQKILSAAGLGSRRSCETYIEAGRVSVDGIVMTKLGAQADPDIQKIEVDGAVLKVPKKTYYLLYKPVGYICSNRQDQTNRPLAVDLIKHTPVRLFCVGRLDVDSKGAILVTNDGDLSNAITHPRYGVSKTYRVRVEGDLDEATLEKLRRGTWLAEGRTGSIEVKVIRSTKRDTLLRLVVNEGKNRMVRRVMAKVGLKVTELERTRIGSVALGKLKPGEYRPLKAAEVNRLKNPGKR